MSRLLLSGLGGGDKGYSPVKSVCQSTARRLDAAVRGGGCTVGPHCMVLTATQIVIPPEARGVRLSDTAVTLEGENRPLREWRPIVWRTDRGLCNRLKEDIFHAFKPPGSDKPLTTAAYCDTLVGPEEAFATAPPLTGILER
ncbi:unnamed protein product [Pleuronectes platessa]|uniref:Uncharacterized protein n=1 Tax=Pleuronectes platessa TaxID=8262 RepID=A0A9N7YFP9_PLEPL|nr:unnamed protein product [Pleuronectes platessa]